MDFLFTLFPYPELAFKCKVFDDKIVIAELTKRQKEVFTLCNVIVPKICGI